MATTVDRPLVEEDECLARGASPLSRKQTHVACVLRVGGTHRSRGLSSTFLLLNTLLLSTYVSAQTRNLPVLELAFPFPVLAPISSTVLF